jgi:hypothetical protein
MEKIDNSNTLKLLLNSLWYIEYSGGYIRKVVFRIHKSSGGGRSNMVDVP